MKKLMRKLVLSSFALGLAVITLSTTTFAWYTSNTDVSATGIAGKSTTDGDSILLISKTGANGTFKNTVNYEINVADLIPVEYTAKTVEALNAEAIELAAPTFESLEADATIAEGATTSTNYIAIPMYFRGADINEAGTATGVKVFLKSLKLTNTTTGNLPTKDVLSETGMPGTWNVQNDPTYSVDILRTINIAYTVATMKPNAENNAHDLPTYSAVGCLNPEGLCTLKDDSLKGYADGAFNAHAYLKAVTGKDIAQSDESSTKGATALNGTQQVELGTTPATTASYNSLRVIMYVYINGWDLACFDAIQGQTISLEMSFSSKAVNCTAGV